MHRRLCVVKNKYDWLKLHTTNEDEVEIADLTSKNNSDFVIDWGDGNVEVVSSNVALYKTHTYSSPFTGFVKIRTVTGSIYEQLQSFQVTKGHFDFNLNIFDAFDTFNTLGIDDYSDTMTISGDLSVSSKISSGLTIRGNNLNITGDISDVKHLSYILILKGSNIDVTYTTTTWTSIPSSRIELDLKPNQLTSQELDQLLQDLDASGVVGTATLDFRGSNEPPTYNAYSNISSLEGKGFTVLVNEADWITLHTSNEDEITINNIVSKNGSDFVIEWENGVFEVVPSGGSVTHTYETPYTGDVRIMTMNGSIYDELDWIQSSKGHWDFDLSVFAPCVDIDTLHFNDYSHNMAITGNLSSVSNVSRYLRLRSNQMSITGDLSVLNVNYYIQLFGDSMTITGDLSDVSNVSNYLYIGGNQITITYTTTTWSQIPSSLLYLRLATGHLTQSEVDQLLNDLAATGDAGSSKIDLRDNNAAPSAASATAITKLQSLGHTVLTKVLTN